MTETQTDELDALKADLRASMETFLVVYRPWLRLILTIGKLSIPLDDIPPEFTQLVAEWSKSFEPLERYAGQIDGANSLNELQVIGKGLMQMFIKGEKGQVGR